VQVGHNGWTVMIRVVQRQHGGSFLRLDLDPKISILDNSVADTEARASFFFHDIGYPIEQFFEGLI
jgi:hypothetical protein